MMELESQQQHQQRLYHHHHHRHHHHHQQQQQRQQQERPSSELWDLVLGFQWNDGIRHVQNVPIDADFVEDQYDETPLFLALQFNPPVEVIAAILEASPATVWIKNGKNKTVALHLACQNYRSALGTTTTTITTRYSSRSSSSTSSSILQVLLRDYPETVFAQTRWGRQTPMMSLWETAQKEKVTVTTPTNPHNNDGDTTDDNNADMSDDTDEIMIMDEAERHRQGLHHYQPPFNDENFRNIILVLIKAVARSIINERDSRHYNDVDDDKESNNTRISTTTAANINDNNSTIHATVSLMLSGPNSCPMEVLDFVMMKYPEQMSQRDTMTGDLPLHVAIRRGFDTYYHFHDYSSLSSSSSTTRRRKTAAKTTKSNCIIKCIATNNKKKNKKSISSKEQELMLKLLRMNPHAARETMTATRTPSSKIDQKDSNSDDMDNRHNHHHRHYDRYPIHTAIATGFTWSNGLKELFLAAPECVFIRDPITQLYPFQLAAVGSATAAAAATALGSSNETPADAANDNTDTTTTMTTTTAIITHKAKTRKESNKNTTGATMNDDDDDDGVDLETVYNLLRTRPDIFQYLQV